MRISYRFSLRVLTEANLDSSWFNALFNRGYVVKVKLSLKLATA